MKDWEIAKEKEKYKQPIGKIAKSLGMMSEEIIPYGHDIVKLDYHKLSSRIDVNNKKAKYIIVTAMTPTPLGEGKTTTVIGLVQGLAKIGKKVSGAIRQPSAGPTFNIKGSAAGGGLSQCLPLEQFSMGLTGDIDKITNAHNLGMVALTARMQHENNYNDEKLKSLNLERLDIDPENIQWGWAIDYCAQALRNIVIGKGGKMDGLEMNSHFQISVSSEIMAILAISKDLKDLRSRISRMVIAYSKDGKEITAKDLEVDGAISALMIDTINPSLLQTIEGQPVLVHAGPFANIAIGQSSIIADKIGCALSEYHVTEGGFGSDIGFEKFINIKCRESGLKPDAAVIVATIKALKYHGEGSENSLEAGCENIIAHIENIKKSGVPPVVCINIFSDDKAEEVDTVKKIVEGNGAVCAVSEHWGKGGDGAVELAEKVIEACEKENNFRFLYDFNDSIESRIEKIAIEIYGADGVVYEDKALKKIESFNDDKRVKKMPICMAKTHLSLSHDPKLRARPKGWILPIKDIMIYRGANFLVPIVGEIKLMPGTGSNPNYRYIDIDIDSCSVTGIS